MSDEQNTPAEGTETVALPKEVTVEAPAAPAVESEGAAPAAPAVESEGAAPAAPAVESEVAAPAAPAVESEAQEETQTRHSKRTAG